MLPQQRAIKEVANFGQIQDLIADGHADPMAGIGGSGEDPVGQVL